MAQGEATAGRRIEPEQVVEAGHPEHPAQGQPQFPRHLVQRSGRQVALPQLHLMQHLNQGGGVGTATADLSADRRHPREPGVWIWCGTTPLTLPLIGPGVRTAAGHR
jgi:hypothetical protein